MRCHPHVRGPLPTCGYLGPMPASDGAADRSGEDDLDPEAVEAEVTESLARRRGDRRPRRRPAAGVPRMRSLVELGRDVVRRAIDADPALEAKLARLGMLNPDAASDPAAAPVSAPDPKVLLGNLVTRVAASGEQRLGSAGIGGLEALAAVLEARNATDGEPWPEEICLAFTDVEAFTSYTEENGDEAALALLRRHALVVEPAIRGRGGTIVKRMGDGLFVRFPNATAALAAMCDCFAGLAVDNADHPDAGIHIRGGLALGRPIKAGTDLVGSDVNLAARLADAAAAGEVLVAAAVRDSVGDDLSRVAFERRGPLQLRGLPEPVEVFAATCHH